MTAFLLVDNATDKPGSHIISLDSGHENLLLILLLVKHIIMLNEIQEFLMTLNSSVLLTLNTHRLIYICDPLFPWSF